MSADWFLKTRGRSNKEDYRWFPVGMVREADPDMITERRCQGRPCYSLIDDEKPGMLLFDDPQYGTALLVTGLISLDHPVDYQHRTIRAALLGTARPGHDSEQRELVAVAVAALRDELAPRLPVRYGVARGVEIDEGSWARFAEEAAGQLSERPESQPLMDEFKIRPDTEDELQRIADSLGTLYLRSGPDAISGRLLILRTAIVRWDDVKTFSPKPWRVIGEVVGAPRQSEGGFDLAKVAEEIVRDPLGSAAKLVRHRFGILSVLVVIAVVAYFISGLIPGGAPHAAPPKPRQVGWKIASVVSPFGTEAGDSIVPLGPREALGAWISPSGHLLVGLWQHGSWADLPLPAGLAGAPSSVKVGADSATDAWVFTSTRIGDGNHSYALHWDGDRLSVAGSLPDGLVVAAVGGPSAAGTIRVTVTSHRAAHGVSAKKAVSVVRQEFVLLRWDGATWRMTRLPMPSDGEFTSISAIAETSLGEVWVTALVAMPTGKRQVALVRVDGDAWQQADIPDSGSGQYSLASDGAGGLWLGSSAGGDLLHYLDGRWTIKSAPAEQGYSTHVKSLIWLPAASSLLGLGIFGPTAETVIVMFVG
jgi:hypothetical protein